MLVTYARVAPLGWTLAVVEDTHAIDTMSVSVVELLLLALLFVALLAVGRCFIGVLNIVRPLQELDRLLAAFLAWGDFDAVRSRSAAFRKLTNCGSRLRKWRSESGPTRRG